MNNKRRGAAVLATIALAALMTSPIIHAGNVKIDEFYITEDSANSITWWIGDSTAVRADFDTSIIYDSRYWDNVTLEVKGRPQTVIGSTDSGAVTYILQMSIDTVYWVPVDSVVAVDSLAKFGNLSVLHYPVARFIAHHGTKSDTAGVRATAKLMARGLK